MKKGQKESKSHRTGRGASNAVFYAHLGYGNHELTAAWHPGPGGTKVRPSEQSAMVEEPSHTLLTLGAHGFRLGWLVPHSGHTDARVKFEMHKKVSSGLKRKE